MIVAFYTPINPNTLFSWEMLQRNCQSSVKEHMQAIVESSISKSWMCLYSCIPIVLQVPSKKNHHKSSVKKLHLQMHVKHGGDTVQYQRRNGSTPTKLLSAALAPNGHHRSNLAWLERMEVFMHILNELKSKG